MSTIWTDRKPDFLLTWLQLNSETSILNAANVVTDSPMNYLWGMRAATFRDSEDNQLCVIETSPAAIG